MQRTTNKENRKLMLEYFNGITKSAELLRRTDLNSVEKDVYAFYENITTNWAMGKSIIPAWEVAYWLGLSEQQVKRAKKVLKEKGLIETDLDKKKGFAHGVGVKANPMGQNCTTYGSKMNHSTYGSKMTYSETDAMGQNCTIAENSDGNDVEEKNDTYGSKMNHSTYGSKMNHKNLNQSKGLSSLNVSLPNVSSNDTLSDSNWILEEPSFKETDVNTTFLWIRVLRSGLSDELGEGSKEWIKEITGLFQSSQNKPGLYEPENKEHQCMLYFLQKANVSLNEKMRLASLCWNGREA